MYRKAISPLIATLILIAITITGGVVVYRLFYSTSNAVSANLHGTIIDATASSAAGASVTVKNDGTTGWTALALDATATTAGVTFGAESCPATVAPGATAVCSMTITGGTVGVTQIVFKATYTGAGSSGTGTATMTVNLAA